MNSNLEKTLRQRQEDKECIICGKDIKECKSIITLQHRILGEVIICPSHIKNSEETKAE